MHVRFIAPSGMELCDPSDLPALLTRTDGLVWVAEKEHDTITRIDPISNKIVDVTPAGNGALSIVRAAGDMWVTNFAGTDLWRFDAG